MMRRPGPLLIAVRAVDALKVYVPFMLLQGGFAERLPQFAQWPWAVFVWLYSLSRVPVLLLDWATIGFEIDQQGISHRAGWPSRTLTRLRWSEVGALSVEQDAVHRFLHRHRVTFSLGAESRPAIILEAISSEEAARWQSWFEQARVVPQPGSAFLNEAKPVAEQVSRVGPLDLMVISVTYGQMVLVIPFAVSTYYELADWFHLPGEASILGWLARSPGWTLLGALVLGAIYGVVRAWLRYGGHRVERVGDGYVISQRAVERASRYVRTAEVAGVRIDQNPLMRLLAMGSLHLVLNKSQADSERLTVLPVAPLPVVERHVRLLMPGPMPTLRRVRVELAATIGVPLLGGAAVLLAVGQVWPAGLTALMALWLINRTSTGVGIGDRRVLFIRGLWARRSYLLGTGALRSLSYWRLGGVCVVSAMLLDRSPTRLLAVGLGVADRETLRTQVAG